MAPKRLWHPQPHSDFEPPGQSAGAVENLEAVWAAVPKPCREAWKTAPRPNSKRLVNQERREDDAEVVES
jgi:hypothetical protein